MPTPCPPLAEQQRAKELFEAGWNKTRIGQELKWDRGTVRKYTNGVQAPSLPGQGGTPEMQETAKWKESEETATFTGITTKPIKTLDELIAVAEVDTRVWYVKSYECTAWTVGMVEKDGKGKRKPVQTQQYRVNAKFERIVKRYITDAYNSIDKWRSKYAPKYPKAFKPKSRGNYLAILGLFDVHLGKLCWAKETGNNYDLKIAEAVFDNAVEDLIAESAHRSVANWVLPLGNDFFHIDSDKNQTTAGTPMDSDGRYGKIFETGFQAVRRAVERLLTLAPVDILWIPGNHDKQASYHLCREVAAQFHNCDQVNVDVGDTLRKYFVYGSNLIGFTHGDKEKRDRLPNIMASEKRNEWATAKCRDWYIGHLHNRQAWVTKPVETFENSTVRVIKSLTGTDSWHFANGFIDDQQAAEVYFYERDNGYAGHGVARARVK